jgi:hypothetical protein
MFRSDADDRPNVPSFVSWRDETGAALSMCVRTTAPRTSRDLSPSVLAALPKVDALLRSTRV